MGLFRVELEATGGHGCQRETKDGEIVQGMCRRSTCPECITLEYFEKMQQFGGITATFTHWPDAANWGGTPIIDEYVPRQSNVAMYKTSQGELIPYVDHVFPHFVRHGSFPR